MIGRHCFVLPDKSVIYEIVNVVENNHNFKFVDLKSLENGEIIRGVNFDIIELTR